MNGPTQESAAQYYIPIDDKEVRCLGLPEFIAQIMAQHSEPLAFQEIL